MSHVHGREGHHYFSDAAPLAGHNSAWQGSSCSSTSPTTPFPVPPHLWDSHLDRLVTLAANMTGCPVARISVIEDHRVVCRASVGAPRLIVPKPQSFCARAASLGGVIISDTPNSDPRFTDLATLPHNQGVRFYLAYPISASDGSTLGILSLRDVLPHDVDETQLAVLADIAALASERLQVLLREPSRTAPPLQQQLKMSETVAGLGYWSYSPTGEAAHFEASPNIQALLQAQAPLSYYRFLHQIPQHLRLKVALCIHRALRRALPFTVETEIIGHTAGSTIKISLHGEPDPQGNVVGILWTR